MVSASSEATSATPSTGRSAICPRCASAPATIRVGSAGIGTPICSRKTLPKIDREAVVEEDGGEVCMAGGLSHGRGRRSGALRLDIPAVRLG